MKAVDTNIAIRLLVRDDEAQYLAAFTLLEAGIVIPITVFLEAGWILGSYYKHDRRQIAAMLDLLMETAGVHVQERVALSIALQLYVNGADFADVIHLVASRGSAAFVTFDQDMPGSEKIGVPVEILRVERKRR